MPKVKVGKETVKFLAFFDHLPSERGRLRPQQHTTARQASEFGLRPPGTSSPISDTLWLRHEAP